MDKDSLEFIYWGEHIIGELPNMIDDKKREYLIPHGEGRIIWTNGSIYEGNFENGVAEGKGRLIGSDGTVY